MDVPLLRMAEERKLTVLDELELRPARLHIAASGSDRHER